MRKRSSRPSSDVNRAAFDAVAKATGQDAKAARSAAAAILGRLGGRKGGPARAKALSAKRRSSIAKKAAQARWKGAK